MGIKFTCPACGRALNIKAELGGKRGRCPKCQAKIDIPTESTPWTKSPSGSHPGTKTAMPAAAAPAAPGTLPEANVESVQPAVAVPSPLTFADDVSTRFAGTLVPDTLGTAAGPFVAAEEQTTVLPASPLTTAPAAAGLAAAGLAAPSVADPIAEAPHLQWYVTPPGAASQYGPAGGEEFRGWIREGRVTADSLVWRQDWPDWRPASAVFPQLQAAAPPAPSAPAAAPAGSAAPAMPVMPPLAGMPLPTAAAAMPMAAGMPPMAQPAFPAPGAGPGMFSAPVATPAAGGFPIATEPPAATRSSSPRGRNYRTKSNTGPIVAIVVLLLAMIPLSFFVWKVVSEQIVSPPPAADSTTGSKEAEE